MAKRVIMKYNDFDIKVNEDNVKTTFDKVLKNEKFQDRTKDLKVRGVRITKHSCGVVDVVFKFSSDKADLNFVIQHSGFRDDLGYGDEFEPKPVVEDPTDKIVSAIANLAKTDK